MHIFLNEGLTLGVHLVHPAPPSLIRHGLITNSLCFTFSLVLIINHNDLVLFPLISCECERGWTGWKCDEDFDECTDKPCLNDGICTQTIEPGNYICECTEQYRGHNCEQLKNRTCEDKPCRNGALCENRKSEYIFLFSLKPL